MPWPIVEIRGQLEGLVLVFSFHRGGLWDRTQWSDSATGVSGQIQQQVPLAAEASHHLSIIFFKLNSSKT